MADNRKPKISAIDLFCGAGGLTHGLILEGITVRAGVDVDPFCEYSYEHNNPGAEFIEKDVKELKVEELTSFYKEGEVRVLAGCAPCQPFSTFRHAYEKKKKEAIEKGEIDEENSVDDKWSLLRSFGRLIKEIDPDIVTMENVPQLTRHDVFKDFVAILEGLGHFVNWKVINCSNYGMPQRRRRLVLLSSKKGKMNFPESSLFANIDNSVEAAIGKLNEIESGSFDPLDELHRCRNLSPLNLRRIAASTPGRTWRDWNEDLLPECYKQKSGETFRSVYGRMKWDEPSPTITTQFLNYGTGRFGHPVQDRAISLREGAILQTFPPNYSFVPEGEPIPINKVGRLIGNAVPVDLGKIVAKIIKEHVDSRYRQ